MSLWVRLLLWLLEHTRFAVVVEETADSSLDDPLLTEVEWLEHCYAISDDSMPTGDSTSEQYPTGS